jgi:hypothetical protein
MNKERNNELSVSRKKMIAYKIVNKNAGDLCFSTLSKFNLFKSADIIHFSNLSKGISKYALIDFDKMVLEYEKINKEKVTKFKIMQEFRPHFKPEFVNFYHANTIKKILKFFGADFNRFNKEYVSISDYSRYVLAIKGFKANTQEEEDKKIKIESCKQRKRIENNKIKEISKIESGLKKKDVCYLYSIKDLDYLENYYSKK